MPGRKAKCNKNKGHDELWEKAQEHANSKRSVNGIEVALHRRESNQFVNDADTEEWQGDQDGI